MEELTEDFEILIVAWLESDNINVTELASSLSELAKKRALILPVVVRQSEQLCDCGGNERVALDCTLKPCKHPKYSIS